MIIRISPDWIFFTPCSATISICTIFGEVPLVMNNGKPVGWYRLESAIYADKVYYF